VKLTVLGGSHASVNTGAGSSGYLVTHEDTNITIDLGPNTVIELRKHTDHRKLDAVLLSHLHIDHFLDILTLRCAIRYNPLKVDRKIPLWLPNGGVAFLNRVVEVIAEQDGDDDYFACFDMKEYDPASALQIGTVTVTFAPTVHAVPGWAMRFEGEGDPRALVYTSDTGTTANLAPFAQGAHVLLSEASYGINPVIEKRRDVRTHMTLGEAVALANDAGVAQLVITHTAEELETDRYVAWAAERFGGPVELATPGLVVDWTAQ
jgi:ribonuclease BN (tRNA processing enzyme)